MATSKFLSDVSVDGKVGINTTSPGSTLEVKGNSTDGWIKLSTTSGNPIITSTNNLSFSVGNTNELLYLNNTNSSVGIGTTSPNALLHVYSTGNGEIEVERASGALFNIQSQSALAAIGTDSNHPLYLKTNAGTRVAITTAGNVGIGTTSPSGKLTVYAPNGNSDSLQIGRADSGSLWKFNHAGADLRIYNTDGSGSDILLGVDAAGTFHNNKVGIGTATPQQNLDVVGAARSTYDSSNYSQLESNASGGVFKALAAGATNILLRSYGDSYFNGGNLGVGTSSPSEKLEVSGNILASGDITAYSDARIKENVETLPNALESVKAMRGVTYNKIGEEKQSIGVIAQEVQAVLPQLVSEHKDEMLSVAYGNITAVLIEAIKEQQDIISQLEERIIDLENRF